MDDASAVIVCGSGPSLAKVPWYEPDYPVAAISTAIRWVPEPDYWLLVDRIKPEHGDEGRAAARNPEIKKVIPKDREKVFRKFPNVETVPRFHPGSESGRSFMDGGVGVLTGLNRSMLFGVQWLSKHFDTLILCGMDLKAKGPAPWVHDFAHPPHGRHVVSMNKNLTKECAQLKQWAPLAKAKGVTWLSWTPESPINRFLEPFVWTLPALSENL